MTELGNTADSTAKQTTRWNFRGGPKELRNEFKALAAASGMTYPQFLQALLEVYKRQREKQPRR